MLGWRPYLLVKKPQQIQPHWHFWTPIVHQVLCEFELCEELIPKWDEICRTCWGKRLGRVKGVRVGGGESSDRGWQRWEREGSTGKESPDHTHFWDSAGQTNGRSQPKAAPGRSPILGKKRMALDCWRFSLGLGAPQGKLCLSLGARESPNIAVPVTLRQVLLNRGAYVHGSHRYFSKSQRCRPA